MAETAWQIPLQSHFQPIDPVANATKGYQMQQEAMNTDTMYQQKQDQDQIQDYLRGGGDLYSEDGIKKAAEDLKGKITPQSYMKLNDYSIDFSEKRAAHVEKMASLPLEAFTRQAKLTDLAYSGLQQPLQSYEGAMLSKPITPKSTKTTSIPRTRTYRRPRPKRCPCSSSRNSR